MKKSTWLGLLVAAIVGLSTAPASAQVSESAQVRKTTSVPESDVRSAIERLRNSLNVPGFAVAIFDENGVVFRETTGSVDEDSRFFLGSLTKALTATLVMRLVERTKLRLKDPARKYLPWDLPRQLRVADLLHHRSGIPRSAGYVSWNGGTSSLERHVEQLDLGSGAHSFEYSNLNYELVGQIIEQITKSSYADSLKRDLTGPLGMEHTVAADSPAGVPSRAKGHQYAFGFPVQQDEARYYTWEIPSRFVASNLTDLVRFGRLHLGDGMIEKSRLLEASHVRPTYSEKGVRQTGHVMGWFAEEYSGLRMLRHEGLTSSHHASMALIPKKDVGVVVLGDINSYGAGAAGMLAKNLALMTAGESTETLSNFEFVLRLALGVALAAFLFLLGIRLTRWVGQGFHVGLLPGSGWRIVPAAAAAVAVVVGIPWYYGVPLFAILTIQPDLAAGLIGIPAAGAFSVLFGELNRSARVRSENDPESSE